MMEQVTLTIFEIRDMYEALCRRCDIRIDVCNDIITSTTYVLTVHRMRVRIREEQLLKTGYEIFYNRLRAACEDKAR